MTHRFVILGNPVVKKNRPQLVRGGIIPNKQYRAWRSGAVLQLKTQWKGEPLEGEMHVTLRFYLGARQRPDLDNLLAAPLDAMEEAGIIKNDYFVTSIETTRQRDTKNPRIEIELTPHRN